MAHNGSQGEKRGILNETGDRWILDTLIPNSDRRLAPSQIQRTSRPTVATKPVLVRDKARPERAYHTPIYSRAETALDLQRRLRRRYEGDEPVEGDILL